MSNLAEKIAFQPRASLARSLSYRPHVRWSYYLLLSAAAFWTISIWLLGLLTHNRSHPEGSTIFICVALTVGAILLGQAVFLIRPLAFSKINVEPDGLTIDRMGQIHAIPFSEVAVVKFSFLPYLGGWFKLKLNSGKSYKFTVVLERSEYILEAMASARPELINLTKMESYRRTAIVADHSWGRFYSLAKNWRSLLLKYAVVPAVLATVVSGLPGTLGKHWLATFVVAQVLNSLSGTVIWIFCELLFMSQGRLALIADPQAVRRNLAYENKIAKLATVSHIGTLTLFAIAFLVWKLLATH